MQTPELPRETEAARLCCRQRRTVLCRTLSREADGSSSAASGRRAGTSVVARRQARTSANTQHHPAGIARPLTIRCCNILVNMHSEPLPWASAVRLCATQVTGYSSLFIEHTADGFSASFLFYWFSFIQFLHFYVLDLSNVAVYRLL